jgi:ABC-type polysaccharide/polyol phosphate export permease
MDEKNVRRIQALSLILLVLFAVLFFFLLALINSYLKALRREFSEFIYINQNLCHDEKTKRLSSKILTSIPKL